MANLEDHPLVNLSRSSNQTYFDSNGVLQTAPANSLPPSYEYNSATGLWEKKGWYIGESRTNKILYSEDFTQSVWALLGASLSSITDDNPINTQAYKIECNSNTDDSRIYYNRISSPDNFRYFTKVLIKKSSNSPAYLGFSLTNNVNCDIIYNLDNHHFENGLNTTENCKRVGPTDDWFVLIIDHGINVNGTRFNIYQGNTRDGDRIDNANLGDSFYLKFVQIEENVSSSSPYIPTSGSTVTRSATLADITDLSWYNPDEGTFVVEFEVNHNFGNPEGVFYIGQSSLNFLTLQGTGSNSSPNFRIRKNNGTIYENTHSLSSGYRFAGSYNNNSIYSSMNGGAILDTSHDGSPVSNTKFILGSGIPTFSDYLNGYIKSLKYYPKRLSNTQLQQLTS